MHEEKTVEGKSSFTIENITAFLVLFVSAYGTIYYFDSKFWVIVAMPIGFAVSGVLAILSMFIVDGISAVSKKYICSAIILVSIAGGTYGLRMYTDHLKLEESKAEQKKEGDKARKEAAREREYMAMDEKESVDFYQSGQDVKTYGRAGDKNFFLPRAMRYIKSVVHDPGSVQDVEATTEATRVRLKTYPLCRSAIGVKFRAKNALGAFVSKGGFVLFDKDAQPFMLVEQSLF